MRGTINFPSFASFEILCSDAHIFYIISIKHDKLFWASEKERKRSNSFIFLNKRRMNYTVLQWYCTSMIPVANFMSISVYTPTL